MNDRELEILRDAAFMIERPDQCPLQDGWFKPMHVGGSDASHHSGTLRRMVKRGWIEKRVWGRAYAYRITEAGVRACSSKTDGNS